MRNVNCILLATGRHCAKGFTLIEVMIAVLVLSIGLLGLAGLQAFGLRNNQDAYMRAQATLLAGDIVERMRANITGAAAGYYNLGTATANADCLDATAGCTAEELALNDLYEWRVGLFNTLSTPTATTAGLGEGVVCKDSTPATSGSSVTDNGCDGAGSLYVVKIWWDTDRDGGMDGYFWTWFQP